MAALQSEDKAPAGHFEDLKSDDAHKVAAKGQAATDEFVLSSTTAIRAPSDIQISFGEPLIHFDPKAESRLRWKIDLCIVPTVALLYLFCFIDRANIGNAKIAGLEKDLGMKGYDYNGVLSVFYISYIIFEIPSNMACKWIGPGWFIPLISLCFGIVSIGTAFVQSRAAISGVRFLLGIFEAGMLPGIAYYMSRWYRRSELAFRLSLYIVMAPLAGAFGGLLASAILKLDSFGSLHTWRMIFAIEGIITCGISVLSFFTLTDRPETARWLTQEEKDLAQARLKSERIGTTEVLDKIDRNKTMLGIFSPVTLTTSFIFLLGEYSLVNFPGISHANNDQTTSPCKVSPSLLLPSSRRYTPKTRSYPSSYTLCHPTLSGDSSPFSSRSYPGASTVVASCSLSRRLL